MTLILQWLGTGIFFELLEPAPAPGLLDANRIFSYLGDSGSVFLDVSR